MANFYGLSNYFYSHILRTYILTMLMTYIIPNVFVLFLSKLRDKKAIAISILVLNETLSILSLF